MILGTHIRETLCRLTPAALVLAFLPQVGVAQVRVSLVASPDDGRPGLRIEGRQNHSCVPTLERVSQDDEGIALLAVQDARDCEAAPTEWRIELAADEVPWPADANAVPVRFMVADGALAGSDNLRLARLEAFEVATLGAAPATPETGLWWASAGGVHDTGGPGTGFSLERQGDRLVLMSNLYGTDGSPRWMISSGGLGEDGVFRAELLGLYGGQTLTGDYFAPEAALNDGEVRLVFHTPAHATAWFTARDADQPGAGLALRAVDLERYAFAVGDSDQPLVGRWVFVFGAEGRGEAFEINFDRAPRRAGWSGSLTDDSRGLRLDCAATLGSVPQRCVLEDADGRLIEFDRIGLNRLEGWDRDGRRALLLRD